MEIIACPNCGSKKIFQGTMGDGVLTGYTTRSVCKNCGYQGMPIIFDTEENYQKFLKEKKTLSKKKEIKKKDKKVLLKKCPSGILILVIIMILQAFFSIYMYYILIGFILTYWIYYITIFLISAIILPYGLLKGKSWAWTLSGLLFALYIPIGLIFLYYITRPNVKQYFNKI